MPVARRNQRTVDGARIELIDIDDSDWRHDPHLPATAQPGAPREQSPRRRVVPVALVGLVAIVVAVAVGASAGSPAARRAPSTVPPITPTTMLDRATAPPTTLDPASSGPSGHGAPGDFQLLAHPPTGFVVAAAQRFPVSAASNDPGAAMLWASTVEADAASRWLIVTARPGAPHRPAGTMRVATSRGIAVVGLADRGVWRLTGAITGGHAELVSAGVTLDELTRAVGAISLVDGRLTYDPATMPVGLSLRSSSQATGTSEWYPSTVATSTYRGRADLGRSITVRTTLRPTLFQQVVEWFFLVGSERVDIDGEIGMIGTNALTGEPRLTFDRRDVHVIIEGDVDEPTLTALGGSLRLVDDEQWHVLAGPKLFSTPPGDAPPPRFELNGDPSTHSPGDYRVEHQPGSAEVYGFEVHVLAGGRPSITSSATDCSTTVTAVAPAGEAGWLLQVSIAGRTETAELRPSGGPSSASIVFTDLGPFTARVVAPDGSVQAGAAPFADPHA